MEWTESMRRFLRNFAMPCAASVADAAYASRVVWPDAEGVVELRKLDVFDAADPPPRVRLVLDQEEAARLKHTSSQWRYRCSFCFFREQVRATKNIMIPYRHNSVVCFMD